jgi:hypothetical protein
MARPRRDIPDSGLAFLDVVSCGFGSVILLLMIAASTIPDEASAYPEGLREDARNLNTQVLSAQSQRDDLKNSFEMTQSRTNDLRRLLDEQRRLDLELQERKRITEAALENARREGDALAEAKQTLTEDLKRLLGRAYKPKNDLVGGIPADSEYIIFIIDTSGSMLNNAWDLLIKKVIETLEVYPEVKGIQVMNDMGEYMFSTYADRWIPDTPGRREVITRRLRNWAPYSNSSPVEGIIKSINRFWAPDRKISIYVFGDEFQGRSIESVIDTVDRINRKDENGNRRVRIHGVGFPVVFSAPPQYQRSGEQFATLMRELARRNGGTFVGLDTAK